MILLKLFWEFLKIGLFSVGGGMATLPFLYDLADSTGWYTYSQLADMLAVSESTPGPVGINMATYVGYTVGGFAGAVTATVGIVLPGVILVLIIVSVLDKFRGNRYVDAAFYGLRPASTALIAAAGVSIMTPTSTEAVSVPSVSSSARASPSSFRAQRSSWREAIIGNMTASLPWTEARSSARS